MFSHEQEAFNRLRQALTSEWVMSYFDPKKPTEVLVDTCPVSQTAIFMQLVHFICKIVIRECWRRIYFLFSEKRCTEIPDSTRSGGGNRKKPPISESNASHIVELLGRSRSYRHCLCQGQIIHPQWINTEKTLHCHSILKQKWRNKLTHRTGVNH